MAWICHGDRLTPNRHAKQLALYPLQPPYEDSRGMYSTCFFFNKPFWRSLYSHCGVFAFCLCVFLFLVFDLIEFVVCLYFVVCGF